jgi:Iap family predicted aminopeptidase
MGQAGALDRLSAAKLAADFAALTALGGRLVGSPSEAAACAWIEQRLRRIPTAKIAAHRFPYRSWASAECGLELIERGATRPVASHPLYWSGATPPDGLEAELVDVGRGNEEEFRACAAALPGRIAMVRHEYPFGTQTIHRRVKYNRSRENGAAGFVIVNNLPGELLVTGSCGQDSPDNIPGVGVSRESGARLGAANAKVRLRITVQRRDATGTNWIAEIPGVTAEWVVVCAHYDGHNLADSAFDNATGVVSALAIFESLQAVVPTRRRGLRLVLFTAEESGLLGSREYVRSLGEAERRRIAAVINLDTLAGSRRLTCLTSEFNELADFAAEAGRAAGVEFGCHRPLLRNSDHFNFAQAGIPALRLVAGFDEPDAGARLLLTGGDRREAVSLDELRHGTMAAGALVRAALDWPGLIAAHKPAATGS